MSDKKFHNFESRQKKRQKFTYEVKFIRITSDCSTQTLKTKRARSEIFQAL